MARRAASVLARLTARRSEIEHAAFLRACAISDPEDVPDPTYVEGLRACVSAALDYGLAAISGEADEDRQVPAALLAQARLAACNGIGFETVLRRYLSGYVLLGELVVDEAGKVGLSNDSLKRLLHLQAHSLECLLTAVIAEHAAEAERRRASPNRHLAARVRKLLAGELAATEDLDYEMSAWHIGAIAVGSGAEQPLRDLAVATDRRLLLVDPGEGSIWAWLGGADRADPGEVKDLALVGFPPRINLSIGEAVQGIAGWRKTHRQAAAGLKIALRGREKVVRYADVALLASVLQDDLLARSLHEIYVAPLVRSRQTGADLRKTLRAYLASEWNISSTAAALGVSRQTVNRRLHAIEERLERPLAACASEVEVALRMEHLLPGAT